MNLKSFLITSLIIHIFGAIVLYFYYNPIALTPKPVKVLKEEKPEQKQAQKQTKKSSLIEAQRKKKSK